MRHRAYEGDDVLQPEVGDGVHNGVPEVSLAHDPVLASNAGVDEHAHRLEGIVVALLPVEPSNAQDAHRTLDTAYLNRVTLARVEVRGINPVVDDETRAVERKAPSTGPLLQIATDEVHGIGTLPYRREVTGLIESHVVEVVSLEADHNGAIQELAHSLPPYEEMTELEVDEVGTKLHECGVLHETPQDSVAIGPPAPREIAHGPPRVAQNRREYRKRQAQTDIGVCGHTGIHVDPPPDVGSTLDLGAHPPILGKARVADDMHVPATIEQPEHAPDDESLRHVGEPRDDESNALTMVGVVSHPDSIVGHDSDPRNRVDAERTRDGPTTPDISVAVSSRQRAHVLPNLIAALEKQTLARDRFEVIVVDDGSTDGTLEVLKRIERETSIDLRVVGLERRSGPAAGRNAAWRLARADVIAFTDDDCQPTPVWLEHGLRAMHRGGGILVGRTTPHPGQFHQWGPFSRTMRVEDTRFLPTCNIFYWKKDLEAVGGFDEGFPTPGGEDTDLGWRVRKKLGREIAFVSEAVVLHDVRPSDFLDKVKTTWRWIGVPRLVAMHPAEGRGQLYRRLFWQPTHPPVILAAAGLSAAILQPKALALVIPWVYLRTRRRRVDPDPLRNLYLLPGTFAIDLLEVIVMLRGSIRYRTFVL